MISFIRRLCASHAVSERRRDGEPAARRAGSVALLLAFLPAAAGAQPLAWEQAVDEAAHANPELRAARETLDAAEYDRRGAYAGYLPQLSGGLSHADTSTSGATSATTTTPSYSASLTATQNLFAGFRDQAGVAQARASRAVAEAGLAIVRARVSFDLKSAFAALTFAQENLKLAVDIVRRRAENLRLVELRFEGGRENKGSYFLSKAALGQARFDRLQAEHAVGVAQEQLARVLGRDATEQLTAVDGVPIAPPALDFDLATVLAATPEHRQAVAQAQVAEAGVGIARAGLLPSLNLSGTAAKQGDDWFPEDRRNTVSLNLAVPLYSGGRDYFATKSATASHAAALADQEGIDRQLRTRLRQAHTRYIEATEKLKVDEDFVTAAETRAEIARNKYNNGLLSFEDWDIIENDLIVRQKALLASRRDRVTAEAAWEQAQGIGVIP